MAKIPEIPGLFYSLFFAGISGIFPQNPRPKCLRLSLASAPRSPSVRFLEAARKRGRRARGKRERRSRGRSRDAARAAGSSPPPTRARWRALETTSHPILFGSRARGDERGGTPRRWEGEGVGGGGAERHTGLPLVRRRSSAAGRRRRRPEASGGALARREPAGKGARRHWTGPAPRRGRPWAPCMCCAHGRWSGLPPPPNGCKADSFWPWASAPKISMALPCLDTRPSKGASCKWCLGTTDGWSAGFRSTHPGTAMSDSSARCQRASPSGPPMRTRPQRCPPRRPCCDARAHDTCGAMPRSSSSSMAQYT